MAKIKDPWQCARQYFEDNLKRRRISPAEIYNAIGDYMQENNFPKRAKRFPASKLLKSRKIGSSLIESLNTQFMQGQRFPYNALAKKDLIYKIAQDASLNILVQMNLACRLDSKPRQNY